ncbi:hypothetical protein [Paenibacillus solani]|uniref:hypothetical protein n=1 Tax=Paenibacillus solani TaxID=1705565 RepID=UPI0013F4E6E6|nr:hypothetical protein [Paenibacillus solani]
MSRNLGTDEREIERFIQLNQSELEKIDVRGAAVYAATNKVELIDKEGNVLLHRC